MKDWVVPICIIFDLNNEICVQIEIYIETSAPGSCAARVQNATRQRGGYDAFCAQCVAVQFTRSGRGRGKLICMEWNELVYCPESIKWNSLGEETAPPKTSPPHWWRNNHPDQAVSFKWRRRSRPAQVSLSYNWGGEDARLHHSTSIESGAEDRSRPSEAIESGKGAPTRPEGGENAPQRPSQWNEGRTVA